MSKRWRWSSIAAAGVLIGAAVLWDPEGPSRAVVLVEAHAQAEDARPVQIASRARMPLLPLPERQSISKVRSNPFEARSWAPPPLPPAPPQAVGSSAPPNPYRFAGTARYGGSLKILLARGDTLIEVREGEPIDDVYQVRSADPEGVTLVYAPLGIEQRVPSSSAPGYGDAGSAPVAAAQLEPGPPLAPPAATAQLPPGSPLTPR